MRGKTYTRAQKWRARARANRFCRIVGLTGNERQMHLYAENRVPCSCFICRDEKYRDTRHHISETIRREQTDI